MTINAVANRVLHDLISKPDRDSTRADNKDLDSLKRSAQPARLRQRKSLVLRFACCTNSLQELRNGGCRRPRCPAILYAIKNNNLKGLKISDQLPRILWHSHSKNSPNLELINKGLTTILDKGNRFRVV